MISRRLFLKVSAAGPLAGLLGCKGDTLSILGYQLGADALYDKSIQTVFVHTFYNRTLQVTPERGMEVSLTQEVVRQITQKTPYRIANVNSADTELIGKIVSLGKNIMNVTQQNQVREGEFVITVDVVWRDLRDGRILSAPKQGRNPNVAPGSVRNPSDPVVDTPTPFDPDVTQPPDKYKTPEPTPCRIVSRSRYLEELGESIASAEQLAEMSVATQIVSMMEKRWGSR